MGFPKKTCQLVLITAVALAVAVPAAGAATGKTVQIAGHLVAPSQPSAVEASVGTAPAATPSDDGFDWNTTAIELSLTGALVFFAAVLGVLWRRGRLTAA